MTNKSYGGGGSSLFRLVLAHGAGSQLEFEDSQHIMKPSKVRASINEGLVRSCEGGGSTGSGT